MLVVLAGAPAGMFWHMMDEEQDVGALPQGLPDEGRPVPDVRGLERRHLGTPRGPMLSPRGVRPALALVVVALIVGLAALGRGLLPGDLAGGQALPTATPSPTRPAAPATVPVAWVPAPGTVVPWLDEPVALPPAPTPVPVSPPPGMPACAATDLRAVLTRYGAAMGTAYADERVTNASPDACYLQGTPGAQVLDEKGKVVLDGMRATQPLPGRPSVMAGPPSWPEIPAPSSRRVPPPTSSSAGPTGAARG